MDTKVADPLNGALIDGRYRVRSRVASGGMATVYTATDERLERTVALKIIRAGHSADRYFLDRFTDEAKTIARLTHPNVVAVYDQGTHDGLPYLIMEYVRGRTLRDVLGERRKLTPHEAVAIMEQVLAAISAAHRAGLVHRDVKPENVLVAEAPIEGTNNLIDSVVKVADFGLARAVEQSVTDGGGQLLATAAYVAPELVSTGHADPRTDVYSAGVVLFEMLTGRVPFEGDKPVDVAWQHVERDVPEPSRYSPGLPAALDDLVTRATRRDPAQRPSDAGAMLTDLQAARDTLGAPGAPGTATSPDGDATMLVPRVDDATQPLRAHDTMIVPQVDTARPAWARLPGSPPRQVSRAAPVPAGPLPGTGPVRSAPQPGTPRAARRARRAAPTRGPMDQVRELVTRVRSHPRGGVLITAALVVVALLVAGAGYWYGIGRYTSTPKLVGLTKPQADDLARKEGLKIRYTDGRYDEQKPKDLVLEQKPAAGKDIVSGGTVTLVLSLGPERYQVPDLTGKNLDLAMGDLTRLKLTAKRVDRYDDNVPAGAVISTDPAPGTVVGPGAEVTVVVSKGPAPITVPTVVGKPLGEAKKQLTDLGLTVLIQQQDSNKPKDEVISQDPPDGSGAEKGAKITLTVSNGPPLVEVPNFQGQPVAAAQQQLQALGMQVQVLGNPAGTVAFMSPTGKQPPGTVITIYGF